MATLTIADLDNGKRDLQTVDEVANSPADSTTTRYGDNVLTLAGALRRLGYKAPVPYAPGLNVDSPLFTVSYGGVVYAPDPEIVPFTTGAWNPAQWRPIQSDTTLRADLAANSGSSLIGHKSTTVDRMLDLVVAVESRGIFPGGSDYTAEINAVIAEVSARGGGTVTFNTPGVFVLGELTFFSGEGAGLTIYRNEWNLLIAKDNVRLHATAPVTLKAADGLVASNKDEGGTKGYSIIGSGIRKVTNFGFTGQFTFDGNGDNNKVFPLNWSGAQAHATAYSFYLAIDGFTADGARFINFPGANVGICEWPSSGVHLRNLTAYRLSDAIAGNTEVVDHSTFYTRATDFKIENVRVEQPTESTVSTPFECHGSGSMRGCTAINTGTGHLSASFVAGHDGVITVDDHTALNVRSGFVGDYQDGAKMRVYVNNARVLLRGAKRVSLGAISRTAHAFTTNEPGTSYVANCDVHYVVRGGTFEQATPIGWDASDNDLNSFARLTRIKGFDCRGATIRGFKSDVARIEAIVPGATVDIIDNTLLNCGTSSEPLVAYRAFTFTNSGLADYAVLLDRLAFRDNRMYGCLYAVFVGTVVLAGGFLIAPKKVEIVGVTTDSQIMPHEGGTPLVEWDWRVNYSITSVAAVNVSNAPSTAAPLYGEIAFPGPVGLLSNLYLKKLKNVTRWYKSTDMWSPSAPAAALPFGDQVGDRYLVQGAAGGSPLFYICKTAGVGTSLGTWVGVAIVP